MTDLLATEKTYLADHQSELVQKHPGKFLLIKGKAVHGAFQTYEQGVIEGTARFGAGPFLVRNVSATSDPEAPNIPALSIGLPFTRLADN